MKRLLQNPKRQSSRQPTRQPTPARLQALLDRKTKPIGSLGRLEDLAVVVGGALRSERPSIKRPVVVVFAGDHGLAQHGCSAYPPAVTGAMVRNFAAGGAAITVLCKALGIDFEVVDAGVDQEFDDLPGVVAAKVARGTAPSHLGPAMSSAQCARALASGAATTRRHLKAGSNVFAFGEMGIGNSASAALLMHGLTGLPIAQCIGRGTGSRGASLARKRRLVAAAARRHADASGPRDLLRRVGGFEIAMMAGAMAALRGQRAVLVVDGFIATSAFAVARALAPGLQEQSVFAHQSEERGHQALLRWLGAAPLLHLSMRLGEGTGAALAIPLIRSAAALLSDMATFESASVPGPA